MTTTTRHRRDLVEEMGAATAREIRKALERLGARDRARILERLQHEKPYIERFGPKVLIWVDGEPLLLCALEDLLGDSDA